MKNEIIDRIEDLQDDCKIREDLSQNKNAEKNWYSARDYLLKAEQCVRWALRKENNND